jgi:hypothetical protein
MNMVWGAVVVLMASWFCLAAAHPYDLQCSTKLTLGQSIMGGLTYANSTYALQVLRGTSQLASGDSFVGGESLTVQFHVPSSIEFMLQAYNARFENGFCNSSVRFYGSSSATLVRCRVCHRADPERLSAYHRAHPDYQTRYFLRPVYAPAFAEPYGYSAFLCP